MPWPFDSGSPKPRFRLYDVDMYVARPSWPSANGRVYQSVCLRESCRDGTRVRKREIANHPTGSHGELRRRPPASQPHLSLRVRHYASAVSEG